MRRTKCSHPNHHTTYETVRGGVNEYSVCTSCGSRTLISHHPS